MRTTDLALQRYTIFMGLIIGKNGQSFAAKPGFTVWFRYSSDRKDQSVNDPAEGSPTATLLRLLLPLDDKI